MRFLLVLALFATTAFAGSVRRTRSELVVKPNSYKDDCKPGDLWRDQDTNKCNCDQEKKAICTKVALETPDGTKLEPTPGWEDIFTPGLYAKQKRDTEAQKEDSNDLIVKPNSYKSDCKVGDEWRDQDCNRCHCDDEKKAVCTKRKCADGKLLEPTEGWEMFPLTIEKKVFRGL